MKLRLKPIRVFCFHHVCKTFDESCMYKHDWNELDSFKSAVLEMRLKGVEFISLSDAYKHICNDIIRTKNYSVITFDDGYASLKEILPWLEQQKIPATLFVNGKYLDGQSFRNNSNEKYLTQAELFSMCNEYIEVADHGWEHVSSTDISSEDFCASVNKDMELLSKHPRYVNFWAYTYGSHNNETDDVLSKLGMIPVLINGGKNYNNKSYIDRELLK